MVEDMNAFAKRCELEALVTEREGMLALNRFREAAGEEQAYTHDDFAGLASRVRELAEEADPAEPKLKRACRTCVHVKVKPNDPICGTCYDHRGKPNWTPRDTAPDAGPCGCEEAEELRRRLEQCEGDLDLRTSERNANRTEIRLLTQERDTARAEVERLQQELAAAREQLPAWAKLGMRAISNAIAGRGRPREAFCGFWASLTPDQRRQREEGP